MLRYLVDAVDLGRNRKGVGRVLASLVPELVAQSTNEIVLAVALEGLARLPRSLHRHAVVVPAGLQSVWEQWGLPRLASTVRADAVYSHRECGALWGPPLVLHIPEDPAVRWSREPAETYRERTRRLYSAVLLQRSLARAAVVAASAPVIARQIAQRHGRNSKSIRIIPLGVDHNGFAPTPLPTADFIFHLGSSDPRDRSTLVVEAWAHAQRGARELPRLVIGGTLGGVSANLIARARALNVRVELLGYLQDEDLQARLRNAAVVVQPSSDEGFGLQPLEALASGAPLVVTRTPVVADVVGDAAVLSEPTAESLGSNISRALDDGPRLRKLAYEQALRFDWSATAGLVLDALEAAAGRRPGQSVHGRLLPEDEDQIAGSTPPRSRGGSHDEDIETLG